MAVGRKLLRYLAQDSGTLGHCELSSISSAMHKHLLRLGKDDVEPLAYAITNLI
jgi:hypothetical protein